MKNRAEGQESFVEHTLNDVIELYKDRLPIDVHIKVKCVCTNDYDIDGEAEKYALNECNPNDIIVLYSPGKKPFEYCMLHVLEINGLRCTKYIECSNNIQHICRYVAEEVERLISKYKRASSVLKDRSLTLSERDKIYKDLRENYIRLGRNLPGGL